MTREQLEILNLIVSFVIGIAWIAGTVVLLAHGTSWTGVGVWIWTCIICVHWSGHWLLKGSTG